MPMQSSMGFDSLFHFVLALLLGLCLPFILLHVLHVKRWKKNMIHGSMGWPFLGETLSFLRPHKSTSLGSFLQDHSSRYGKVFRSHLFGSPTVVSCDHELNAFVLQNEEKLFQCSYPKAIHGVLGKLSMIVVVGDAHKRLRSITLGLTNQWKFKDEILYDIERQVISMMESWKSRNEVVFCEEAKKFTFNVIVKQILSLRPEEPQTMKILEDFHTFMRGLISFPLYIPGSSYAKAVKARVRISSTVMKIIEKRRVDRKLGCEKGDFLDELLLSSTLNDDEKVSLALDLLLAGYETTSLLMSLSMYFLASSPLVLQQLKEEHQKISDRIKGNHLKLEDYNQMEFTQDVINEVLRCGNIVKFVHRRALKDVSFKGYFIPSGWKILPVLSSVHLDPSLHENPFEFSPWRWKDQGTLKKLACFGGGLRMCPGAELAKVETAFFLHHLVLNFRWKVQGEDHPYAHPYVEFERGLPLTIEHIKKAIRGDMCNQVVQTREIFY